MPPRTAPACSTGASDFVEAVTERDGKQAYYVSRSADGAVTEQPLETRLLTAP